LVSLSQSRPVNGFSFYDWLIRFCTTYIVLRWTIENTSIAQQWIYANHIENNSSFIVVFTARCTATEVIWLLPAYSNCCPATGLHVTISYSYNHMSWTYLFV
jgi:hypothetical protein